MYESDGFNKQGRTIIILLNPSDSFHSSLEQERGYLRGTL